MNRCLGLGPKTASWPMPSLRFNPAGFAPPPVTNARLHETRTVSLPHWLTLWFLKKERSCLATKGRRGRRCGVNILLPSSSLCGLQSILKRTIQDRSCLEEQMRSQSGSEDVRDGRTPGSCRCGLPRAEGRKVAAARGEGRSPVAVNESSNKASCRPSGQRVAATFQAAGRRSASRLSGSWCAPVGALMSTAVLNWLQFFSWRVATLSRPIWYNYRQYETL